MKSALTERELAERLGLSVRTLQSWRREGNGLNYLKIGSAIRYPLSVVEQFEATSLVKVGVE
jgi:hypothetical protein